LWKKIYYFIKKQLLKMLWSEVWKGGISIDADSGPFRNVLWCFGGICHQQDTFIQIGSDHTVGLMCKYFLKWTENLRTNFWLQFLQKTKKEIVLNSSLCSKLDRIKNKRISLPYVRHYKPRLVHFLPHFSLKFKL
jgi:hypothetical protein